MLRQQEWEDSGALTICRPSDAHPERVPGREDERVREVLTLEGGKEGEGVCAFGQC